MFQDLKGLFSSESVSFKFSIDPANMSLIADRSLIEQLLINLLKNAEEVTLGCYLPKISVEAFRQEGKPVIKLTDNGNGIIPEVLDKVFVPFFTTKAGGSGIGLSICRQIMNRHGGSIAVSSEVEKGTVFTLEFPPTRTIL